MDEVTPDVLCSYCESVLSEEYRVMMPDGTLSCVDCANVCDACGEGTHNDYTTWANDYAYCESCRDQHLFWCDHCEEYLHERRVSRGTVGGQILCEDCIGANASWCDIHEEYEWDTDYCDQDDPEPDDVKLHPYGYKPKPIFQGEDKHRMYLGWELEAQGTGRPLRDAVDYAYRLESEFNIAYLKMDSSVSGGFEIVTHPFAHNKIRDAHAYWETVEQLRTNYRMRSWDTDCCGLHIHISRDGFNGGAHLHRFLRLVYGNAEMMARFGGRKSNHYADFGDVWKSNDYGVPIRTFKHKVEGSGSWSRSQRHSAVNTTNPETIELRFFRGTLRKESILAALDFAHAAVEYTRDLRSPDVMSGALEWDMFMMWVEDNNGIYPDLYVKSNKIHTVNLDKHTHQDA